MEIIHIVLGKANPERMNGVNKVVYQLATRQAASGRNVAIWGITKDTTHNYGERIFSTRLFKAHKNPFVLDAELVKALRTLQGKVIVHLHGGWIPLYATLSRILKKLGIPFLLTAHGAYNTIAMRRSGFMKKLYFRLFEQKLLKCAAAIHAIGESEVTGLNEIFPNQKSILLPYGYSGTSLQNHTTAQPNSFIIGFIGRTDIYTKGLDLLLDAFWLLNQQHPETILWIIGDSPEQVTLATMLENKGLKGKAFLLGGKFGDEKEALLQQISVFAHPSRNEGLPTSVLEAAFLGVPCVVSKATNVGQYIEQYQAGIVVEDESVKSLESAFLLMHDSWEIGNLPAIGLNAKRMVREAFDWNSILQSLDEVFTKALEKKF